MEEERAMGDLARVIAKLNIEESGHKKALATRKAQMDEFARQHSDHFQIDLYQIYDRYIERLDMQARASLKNIEKLQPELKIEQEKLKKARVKKRVIELLKEKKYNLYKKELEKADLKEIEEINTMRKANIKNTGGSSEYRSYKGFEIRHSESDDEDETFEDTEGAELDEKKRDAVDEYFEQFGIERPGKK